MCVSKVSDKRSTVVCKMTTPSLPQTSNSGANSASAHSASANSASANSASAISSSANSSSASKPSDLEFVEFPVLATLARINVGDKLLSEGPDLDVQPPAYLTPLYRWLGGESRTRNLARVSTQLGSMFDAVATMRQPASCSSSMSASTRQYFANLETQLRAAATGLSNLKATYTGKVADNSPADAAETQDSAAAFAAAAATAAEEVVTLNNLILQLTAVANEIKASTHTAKIDEPAITHAPLTRASAAETAAAATATVAAAVAATATAAVTSARPLTWVDAVKQSAQSSSTAAPTVGSKANAAAFFSGDGDDYLDDLFSDDEFDDNDDDSVFHSAQTVQKS